MELTKAWYCRLSGFELESNEGYELQISSIYVHARVGGNVGFTGFFRLSKWHSGHCKIKWICGSGYLNMLILSGRLRHEPAAPYIL